MHYMKNVVHQNPRDPEICTTLLQCLFGLLTALGSAGVADIDKNHAPPLDLGPDKAASRLSIPTLRTGRACIGMTQGHAHSICCW